jgi:hypothetical protein
MKLQYKDRGCNKVLPGKAYDALQGALIDEYGGMVE